ncbi:uncharacterized protein LOC112557396 [Pomacea canaliculata]|uniref:uncharacterized protein LOC112557396 n=1 Tax=Pomacea canaliculata TaxID=400727 RepID=UPI000D73F69E|nr:uncharacterized protein LOC112557396 [Pomacea canaliculata]
MDDDGHLRQRQRLLYRGYMAKAAEECRCNGGHDRGQSVARCHCNPRDEWRPSTHLSQRVDPLPGSATCCCPSSGSAGGRAERKDRVLCVPCGRPDPPGHGLQFSPGRSLFNRTEGNGRHLHQLLHGLAKPYIVAQNNLSAPGGSRVSDSLPGRARHGSQQCTGRLGCPPARRGTEGELRGLHGGGRQERRYGQQPELRCVAGRR